MSIWPISRDMIDRIVIVPSSLSTETRILRVELLRGQPRRPVDHLADKPDVVVDHLGQQVHVGHLLSAGSRRLPGGWKCTPFGESSRIGVGVDRHAEGDSP